MSPSITEIIAQKKAQEESQSEREEREIIKREMEYNRKVAKEKKEYGQRVERIFKKSGVLEALEEINRDLLSDIKKHDLVIDLENGRAFLVWGNKYTFDYNYKLGTFEFRNLGEIENCSMISIYYSLMPNIDEISVSGQESQTILPFYRFYRHQTEIDKALDKLGEWDPLFSKTEVKTAIASAYLKPKRIVYPTTPTYSDYSSSSSGASNCECCCECGAG